MASALLDVFTEPGWYVLPLMLLPLALAIGGRSRARLNLLRRWRRLPVFRVVFLWPFAAASMCFCACALSAWNQVGYFPGPWLSGRPESVVGRLVLQLLIAGIYLKAQHELFLLALGTLESSFGGTAPAELASKIAPPTAESRPSNARSRPVQS